jgi:hypothetical protein
MGLKIVIALISGIALLGCASDGRSSSISNTNVTKIVIRLPGKISVPDDDLFKVITDPSQIARIVKFADMQFSQRFGWQRDGYSMLPRPFFTLRFLDGENYVRGFGFGGSFVSFSDSQHGYRIRKITKQEGKEFLDLIGITEEEYQKLEKEWLDPNSTSWKKENADWLKRARAKSRKKPND